MCLAVFGLDAHPDYALVIAANRDEYHRRAAEPAHWWPEGWLAGRDLAAGGTWLGVTRTGRWALLTNIREPHLRNADAPTRGALVTRVLEGDAPQRVLQDIGTEMGRYNGFNLVAGEGARAWWLSNRAGGPHPLSERVHTLSNAALDTPWPKVVETRDALERWCRAGEHDVEVLFAMLGSRAMATDEALPRTGIPMARERALSARFIVLPDYGTRCSTVITVGHDGEASFEERTFDAAGAFVSEVAHRFRVIPTPTLTASGSSPDAECPLP